MHQPGCRCPHCEPGLTNLPPAAGEHTIDRGDLDLLVRLGLHQAARQIAAGTCPHCGYSRAGLAHRETCQQPLRPVPAPTPIRQPWEPRPSRRLAA